MKTLTTLLLAAGVASTATAAMPQASDYVSVALPTLVLSGAVVDASGMPMNLTPHALLATSAVLSVLAVYDEGDGFSWLLERPADGARFSVRMADRLADGVSIAPGAVVCISLSSAGALLSAAGRVVGFVPNAAGKKLLHHERVSD